VPQRPRLVSIVSCRVPEASIDPNLKPIVEAPPLPEEINSFLREP
jgi:hypothetical protein